jgi:hypothetical protein
VCTVERTVKAPSDPEASQVGQRARRTATTTRQRVELNKRTKTARILLANLLQSSRSTLSRGSFLSFLAFKEGMLSTPISILGGWPTVSAR